MAVRTAFAIAREEAATITSELVITARTAAESSAGSTAAGVGAAERKVLADAVNPVAVRQAAEASVRTAAEDCSLLTHHLSHAPSLQPTQLTSILSEASGNPLVSSALSSTSGSGASRVGAGAGAGATRALVSQTLEEEGGVTLKEVMNNAAQTGVEEQMDQVVDIAKTLVGGGSGNALGDGGAVLAEVKEGVAMVSA